MPNALDTAPDGETLYFADSKKHILRAYALDAATGELGAPRLLREYPAGESPDGITVAADGTLWLAVMGGGPIECLDPSGRLIDRVPLPVSRPTAPAFGGPGLTSLFVTSQRRFLEADTLAQEPAAGSLIEVPGCGEGRTPFGARLA